MDENSQLNSTNQTPLMIDRIVVGLGEFRKAGFTAISVNDNLICGGDNQMPDEAKAKLEVAGWKYWKSHGCWMFDCTEE